MNLRVLLICWRWWEQPYRQHGTGKALVTPLQPLAQQRPVKPRARIGLAPGRNVLVAGDVGDGVARRQVVAQRAQGGVLRRLKALAFQAL